MIFLGFYSTLVVILLMGYDVVLPRIIYPICTFVPYLSPWLLEIRVNLLLLPMFACIFLLCMFSVVVVISSTLKVEPVSAASSLRLQCSSVSLGDVSTPLITNDSSERGCAAGEYELGADMKKRPLVDRFLDQHIIVDIRVDPRSCSRMVR
jgi:hypothetical protein